MDILDQCDPATTAVLVVDMQHAYCSPHDAAVRMGDLEKSDAEYITTKFVPHLIAFLNEARIRRFTIIHTRIFNPHNPIDSSYCEHCWPKKGEEEFRRYDAGDTIFKNEGFWNWCLFGGAHIERLLIVGVYSDACVDRQARHAKNLGYEVIVPPQLTYP